jgi:hypothetical protein
MERHEYGKEKGQGKMAIPEKGLVCAMCEKMEHASMACYHRRNPDANTANTTWKGSVPGKAWAARGVMTQPLNRTLRIEPISPGQRNNHGEMIPMHIMQ